MRKFLFIPIFILALCFAAFGQNSPCPTIRISGPPSALQPGESMTFTIGVDGFDLNKIGYEWSVSDGTIVEGQNTPVIKVDTTGLNHTPITATVKIKSLPVGCADSVSETGIIAGCALPITLDDYEKISWKEEKYRLSSVAMELQKDDNAVALFTIYYTSKDNKNTLKNRILRISNFLTQENKIPKQRIAFIFGGMENAERTRIFLSPVESGLGNTDWNESLKTLNLKNK